MYVVLEAVLSEHTEISSNYLVQMAMTDADPCSAILEVMINAALAGHDLGPFEDVTDRINGG